MQSLYQLRHFFFHVPRVDIAVLSLFTLVICNNFVSKANARDILFFPFRVAEKNEVNPSALNRNCDDFSFWWIFVFGTKKFLVFVIAFRTILYIFWGENCRILYFGKFLYKRGFDSIDRFCLQFSQNVTRFLSLPTRESNLCQLDAVFPEQKLQSDVENNCRTVFFDKFSHEQRLITRVVYNDIFLNRYRRTRKIF